jgi:peroxiredoxin (alkyl hydroperoxide reductase subunit C)
MILDPFPDLEVYTTKGKMRLPRDYSGKWFVLFSHPGDFIPVCTTEFVAFQRRYDEFRMLDCELIGLAVDQLFPHIEWIMWIKENLGVAIEFPLIAHFGGMSDLFGMVHPVHGSITVRNVYIVDPKGIIRSILIYPAEIGRSIDEILRIVRALKKAESEQVLTPADWPRNDLIGDHVIERPSIVLEEAVVRKERISEGKLEGYAWWFLHRKAKDGSE